MITVSFNSKKLEKDMAGALEYASGFLEGIQQGKPIMLKNVGYKVKEVLYAFIDSTARTNPQALHHVYEWYQVGSPNARLFDIECTVTGKGLTFSHTFSQSRSVQAGSRVPFYNKASIMENGIGVTIVPKKSGVLAFEDNGEEVFTRKPVHVSDPGGSAVQGSFSETLKMFFNSYLSQSLLDVTGIRAQLNDMSDFKRNLPRAKSGGRSLGINTGKQWVSKVGTIE